MKRRNREVNIFSMSMLDVLSCALGAFLLIMLVLFYYAKPTLEAVSNIQKEKEEIEEKLAVVTNDLETSEEKRKECEEQLNKALANLQNAETANKECEERVREAREALQRAVAENDVCSEQLREVRVALQTAEAKAAAAAGNLEDCEARMERTFLVVYIKWKAVNHDIDLWVIDPDGNKFYFDKKKITGVPGELSEDSLVGPGNEIWEIRDAPAGTYKVYANFYKKSANNSNPAIIKGRVIYRDGSSILPVTTLNTEGENKLMMTITVKPNGEVETR